ncbi:MAG: hypothetical protein WBD31_21665 [Rubripirellula sp.]
MFSLRPFTTALLLALVCLGHLPAWVHVAYCHDPACVSGGAAEAHAAGHSHGHGVSGSRSHCHHRCLHSGKSLDEAGSGDQAGLPSDSTEELPPHDSDTCAVCQSLATPCGFVGLDCGETPIQLLEQPISLPRDSDPLAADQFLPPARGPPWMLG